MLFKVLHSVCQQVWKTHQWPQDWKRSVFIEVPKKGNAKECSNYRMIVVISHASNVQNSPSQASVMFKILQPGTMNFHMLKVELEKAKEPEIKLCWIIKKAREFQKSIYFCFIDYAEAFECVDHNKLWKILQEMGIPGHLKSLLRNLYVSQEVTVRIGHGTTDWFQNKKRVCQGFMAFYCHPAYLTYMQSTSWETLGWMKHKLESRLLGEISITSDMQMTPTLWQTVKKN